MSGNVATTASDAVTPPSPVESALAAFEPITLAQMDGVRLLDRVDTKYAFEADELADLLASVADRYRVLDIDGMRQSPYSTLYYDTPQLDCYHEHHNGKANRRKYRVRTYVSSGDTFFEMKTKTNKGRTVKQRRPVPMARDAAADNAAELSTASFVANADSTSTPSPAALAQSLAGETICLTPQITTRFLRITLVGRHAPERVTIDTNLSFAAGNDCKQLGGLVIAEVKQERARRDSAISVRLRSLGIRPLRLSKYCLGTAMLHPTLKRNAFKAKLLALRLSPSEDTK